MLTDGIYSYLKSKSFVGGFSVNKFLIFLILTFKAPRIVLKQLDKIIKDLM